MSMGTGDVVKMDLEFDIETNDYECGIMVMDVNLLSISIDKAGRDW